MKDVLERKELALKVGKRWERRGLDPVLPLC